MPEFRLDRAKTISTNEKKPVVQMSLGAYERLQDKLARLFAIEEAARRVVNIYATDPMLGPAHPYKQLERAIRAYDGWEDDDEAVNDVIEEMKHIIKDLESRDEL